MVYTIVTLVELQALPLTLNRSMHVMLLGETWNLMVTFAPPLRNVDPDEARKTCRFTTHHKYKTDFICIFLKRNTIFLKSIFQQDPGCCFWKNTADHIFFHDVFRLPLGFTDGLFRSFPASMSLLPKRTSKSPSQLPAFWPFLGVKLWKKVRVGGAEGVFEFRNP